ncbi:hypothetical protein BJ878DRAFT_274751 [Calycina marina]|uniref:Uncharacterized protein n=1 Tax=Calycina marina TaxID=1763456 RepID=A0A9P7YVE3_9HELO|nr:hypothetical protein BJ878DRAFT_274751 [Calycina marina]
MGTCLHSNHSSSSFLPVSLPIAFLLLHLLSFLLLIPSSTTSQLQLGRISCNTSPLSFHDFSKDHSYRPILASNPAALQGRGSDFAT